MKIVLEYPSSDDEKRIYKQECTSKSVPTKTTKTKVEKR
jgi:hypothetical protein